jgi:hypothetical protein
MSQRKSSNYREYRSPITSFWSGRRIGTRVRREYN